MSPSKPLNLSRRRMLTSAQCLQSLSQGAAAMEAAGVTDETAGHKTYQQAPAPFSAPRPAHPARARP